MYVFKLGTLEKKGIEEISGKQDELVNHVTEYLVDLKRLLE